MNIIFLDLETTGLLDAPDFRITEIAWAVYDPIVRRVVRSHSALVNELEDGQQITAKIYDLTGLDTRTIFDYGVKLKEEIEYLRPHMERTMAMFARNGIAFDKPALEREIKRLGLAPMPEKVWIDDYIDIDYPESVKGTSLSYVAADHGFLNPFPHIAIGDVLTLMRVMQMGGYDLEDAYESAKAPLVEVQAMVSYENRNLASRVGFRWDGDRKVWWKRMRKNKLEALNGAMCVDGWEFKVRECARG